MSLPVTRDVNAAEVPRAVTKWVDSDMRRKIEGMESFLRTQEQLPQQLTHHFSQGVYARELVIPKDAIITGKIHKYAQLNILSKGDISVLTENGVIRVRAPFTLVSPPGTKRIAYAHEECVWTTIHGTELLDLDQIEAVFIAQSDAEYLEYKETLLLENKL